MKKLIFILFPVIINGQSIKVSSLPTATTIDASSLFVMNQGGTPDTTKKLPGSVLFSQISSQITDSFSARGIAPNQDNILDWRSDAYRPYQTRSAQGIIYRGDSIPTGYDSLATYNGYWKATELRAASIRAINSIGKTYSGYQSLISTTTINHYNWTNGQYGFKIAPTSNVSPYYFNSYTTLGASDTLFNVNNYNTKLFSILGNGKTTILGDINSLVLKSSGSTKTAACFYTGTTNPDGFTRLNWNGSFFVNGLYSYDAASIYGDLTTTGALGVTGKISQGGVSADSGINVTSANITGQVKASGLESNLGKYNLTMNSSTKEIYAQELAHAFYGFADSSRSMSLSSNATWYHVTNTWKNLWTNYEDDYVSISNDTIILGATAHWEFHYHVIFTGTTGVWFKMRLFNVTNNTAIPISTAGTANGTNFVSIGNTAYCTDCESGDKIVLQMIPESNSQTITLIDGSVLVKATHGTQ